MQLNKRKYYIKEYGINSLIWFFYSRLNNEKKHKSICNYLKKELKDIIQKYKTETKATTILSKKAEKIIWVLWWNGEEKMPELISACINSIKKNSNIYQVIILSQYNYKKYISFPEKILEHYLKGHIEIVHMADILRVLLLSEYGGIWLDATVFLSNPLPLEYSEYIFYSRKINTPINTRFASKGRWTGYFMATSISHSLLFEFLKDSYIYFWKKHDIIIDYFLLDYLILIAYEEFEVVKQIIESIPINNENTKSLYELLNKEFNQINWEKINKKTIIYKLSWKEKYKYQINNVDTYYSKIVLGKMK